MQEQLTGHLFTLMDEDEYTAMTVNSQDALDLVSSQIGKVLRSVEGGRLLRSFPRTLPFSKAFPVMCGMISRFLELFWEFSEGFSSQWMELDDFVKKVIGVEIDFPIQIHDEHEI